MIQTPPPGYTYQQGHARQPRSALTITGITVAACGAVAVVLGVAGLLYSGNHASLCDSGLGALAQAASKTAAQDCRAWNDIDNMAVLALTAGIIAGIAGLVMLLFAARRAPVIPAAVTAVPRPRRRWPWVTAGCAAVAVALLVVLAVIGAHVGAKPAGYQRIPALEAQLRKVSDQSFADSKTDAGITVTKVRCTESSLTRAVCTEWTSAGITLRLTVRITADGSNFYPVGKARVISSG